jgi:hypothetical protein
MDLNRGSPAGRLPSHPIPIKYFGDYQRLCSNADVLVLTGGYVRPILGRCEALRGYERNSVDLATDVHTFHIDLGRRCLGLAAAIGFFAYFVGATYGLIHNGTSISAWHTSAIVLTPLFAVLGLRFWRTEVRVSPDSIVVRDPLKTRHIPAKEIRSIDLGRARGSGEAVKESHVWHPYIQVADGSVLWMSAMEGGTAYFPSEDLLAQVTQIRRLLRVGGTNHCSRMAQPVWQRSWRKQNRRGS